jgi:hypothetical protein
MSPHHRGPLAEVPISIELDFYPLTIIPTYGIIAGMDSQILNQKTAGFTLFKVKSSVCPSIVDHLTDLCQEPALYPSNSSPIT